MHSADHVKCVLDFDYLYDFIIVFTKIIGLMEDSQDALVVEKKEGGDFDDNMASEESDDDLLSPPMFLYEPRRLSQIQTPVKVLTPANSDLSPIRPSDEIEQKKKRKLCFSKLVQERAEQDENDKKLSKMNKELKEGLDNGKDN